MPDSWKDKALTATHGSQFGAILACVFNPVPAKRECPYFAGNAVVTSDGFVMCDFVDRGGNGHHGAFVDSMRDLESRIEKLTLHLRLNAEDAAELRALFKAWISIDYRTAQSATR